LAGDAADMDFTFWSNDMQLSQARLFPSTWLIGVMGQHSSILSRESTADRTSALMGRHVVLFLGSRVFSHDTQA
jgi:hypothetical protein